MPIALFVPCFTLVVINKQCLLINTLDNKHEEHLVCANYFGAYTTLDSATADMPGCCAYGSQQNDVEWFFSMTILHVIKTLILMTAALFCFIRCNKKHFPTRYTIFCFISVAEITNKNKYTTKKKVL